MTARCPICGRRRATWHCVVQHAKDKHGKALSSGPPPEKKARPDDDDESYADRAIQAEQDHAAGIPNPDIEWLTPHLLESK